MIEIDKAKPFVVSKEKPLCEKCSGLGTIWAMQIEKTCNQCNGTGLSNTNKK